MSLSLSRRPDGLFAPLGHTQETKIHESRPDELQRDGQAIGGKADGKGDGREMRVAPGELKAGSPVVLGPGLC